MSTNFVEESIDCSDKPIVMVRLIVFQLLMNRFSKPVQNQSPIKIPANASDQCFFDCFFFFGVGTFGKYVVGHLPIQLMLPWRKNPGAANESCCN